MPKMKILVLTLVLIMSTTLLSTATAKVEKPTIKFSAVATGECVVAPILGPTTEPFFVGKGMIVVTGSAYATANPPSGYPPVTYYLTDAGVAAIGIVSVRWADNRIDVVLSSSTAQGFFVDEGEYSDFFVAGGLPGGDLNIPPTSALSYHGRIHDSAGTRPISGKAIALAIPFGGSPDSFPFIGVILFNSDGSVLKDILWAPVDVTIPGLTLHAANAFMNSVKIKI